MKKNICFRKNMLEFMKVNEELSEGYLASWAPTGGQLDGHVLEVQRERLKELRRCLDRSDRWPNGRNMASKMSESIDL